MEHDTAAFWDERYRHEEAVPERGPALFLTDNADLLPPSGRALDVGMGTGRNAIFLAKRGLQVTGVDISPVGVERAREAAERLGLPLEGVVADLRTYELRESEFDVALNFYFLMRDACPAIARALRPGGVIVFETFTTEHRQFGWGPTDDDHLLQPGELRGLFPGFEELMYREGTVLESERGRKAIASLMARKP